MIETNLNILERLNLQKKNLDLENFNLPPSAIVKILNPYYATKYLKTITILETNS